MFCNSGLYVSSLFATGPWLFETEVLVVVNLRPIIRADSAVMVCCRRRLLLLRDGSFFTSADLLSCFQGQLGYGLRRRINGSGVSSSIYIFFTKRKVLIYMCVIYCQRQFERADGGSKLLHTNRRTWGWSAMNAYIIINNNIIIII